MKFKLLFGLLFLGQCLMGNSFDFDQYLLSHKNDSTQQLLDSFPYEAYLGTYSIDNIAVLESHRKMLHNNAIDGDDFVYELFGQFMELNPLDYKNIAVISSMVELGIVYRNIDKTIIESTSIYKTVGRGILKKTSSYIEQEIKNKHLDPNDIEIEYLIRKLDQNKFIIDIQPSDIKKAMDRIKDGDWEYLGRKFKSRFSDKKHIYIPVLSIVFIMIGVFIYKKINKIKKS